MLEIWLGMDEKRFDSKQSTVCQLHETNETKGRRLILGLPTFDEKTRGLLDSVCLSLSSQPYHLLEVAPRLAQSSELSSG